MQSFSDLFPLYSSLNLESFANVINLLFVAMENERPKRISAQAVYKMLGDMSDEEYGILSDDDSLYDEETTRSRSRSIVVV